MKYLFLESFYQGSHALFADGLINHSAHDIDLMTMPGENWKWRMLGSALYFADNIPPLDNYDGIIVTDLFNLADFKAAVGPKCPPVLVYFHENQITYPPPPGDKGAFQIGIINISTALFADMVVFNSNTHRETFLNTVPEYLEKGRDFRPLNVSERIREKSCVCYPGITLPAVSITEAEKLKTPPLIIWNHRWSYDKNYKLFFNVLKEIEEMGLDFKLAVLGESDGRRLDQFEEAEKQFKNRILQFGFVPSRKEYAAWLSRGAIVISTAKQENFGFSVIEAMTMGCLPLLPNRLSYPEILPDRFHKHFLYHNNKELVEKLAAMISEHKKYDDFSESLSKEMSVFLWEHTAAKYDEILRQLANTKRLP